MDPTARKHFNDPRNRGELPAPDGSGQAGDRGCGAVITLQIGFNGDSIERAAFNASGSAEIIVAGSILTEMIKGKSWRVAAAFSADELRQLLLAPPVKASQRKKGNAASVQASEGARAGQAADFAIEALHAALEDSLWNGRFPVPAEVTPVSAIVAMSGGVDSSTACLLAMRAGLKVTGITMRLWSDPDCDIQGNAPSCCSPQAIRDARQACHKLGLPHLTVDFREQFRRMVVEHFVAEYIAGRTPNPCTRCNGAFRFPELAALAGRLGAARVMTGHYARIVEDGGPEGHMRIARGADPVKDQSYMLWGIEPPLLPLLKFPLGGMRKEETRRIARAAGLQAHARPESQEICFIPDKDYRRFIRSRVDELPGEGDIENSSGRRLGAHSGYVDYTVGQRHGLGISGRKPYYVLRTVPADNIVIAGSHAELTVRTLTITNVCSQIAHESAVTKNGLLAQVRYNSPPVPCRVAGIEGDSWRIELLEPVFGVAPGQSAVIYDGDAVAAGGVISRTHRR